MFPIGVHLWDKSLGDAAYATMIFFMVAFVRPGWRSLLIGAVALVLCVAIECFQLTGMPLRLPRIFQIALGTTFAWHDLACYAVGAAAPTALLWSRARGPRPEA
ncbi:MAG TPA: DUF2809 domain-containing protein [Labilithrix sp.]|nr:DUF2809 domain-containing protein [Labilithrix sp.]